MSLFTLPASPEPNQTAAPTDLSGFERYYALLRVLTNVQEEATFYERLRILLTLARRRGEPPTAQALSRVLPGSAEGLVQNLARLRSAGWACSRFSRIRQ